MDVLQVRRFTVQADKATTAKLRLGCCIQSKILTTSVCNHAMTEIAATERQKQAAEAAGSKEGKEQAKLYLVAVEDLLNDLTLELGHTKSNKTVISTFIQRGREKKSYRLGKRTCSFTFKRHFACWTGRRCPVTLRAASSRMAFEKDIASRQYQRSPNNGKANNLDKLRDTVSQKMDGEAEDLLAWGRQDAHCRA